MLTLADISDRLKREDEVTLMELLQITSEDLVDRFQDRIEEHADKLEDDLDD